MDNLIVQISIALVAVAFVVLVIFLTMALRSVSSTLSQTNGLIRELQGQINGLSKEATALLRHTNEVTVDVRNKLHSIDPVLYSVKNIGDAVQEVTSSLKEASSSVANTIQHKVAHDHPLASDKVIRVMQLVPMVLDVWQAFRNRSKKEMAAGN